MWNKSAKSKILGFFLLLLLIYVGYLRYDLFVTINYIIEQLYYSKDLAYFEIHPFYKHLIPLGVSGLYKAKWVFTIMFFIANLSLSIGVLKSFFTNHQNAIRLLILGSVFLFLLSGGLFIGGKLIGQENLGYTLSRRFMGVLQSPVPLMVVSIVHLLFAYPSKQIHK